MKTEITKVAMIRDPDAPTGQPATLYLKCLCGFRPVSTPEVNVRCECGMVYTSMGWVVR